MTCSRIGLRVLAIITGLFTLAGCSLHYINQSSLQQAPHYAIWHHVANGDFLCLTTVPGTPIYGGGYQSEEIVDRTGSVVAFAGIQDEHRLAIQRNNGILGYVEDSAVKIFQPAYPGQECIVTRDLSQHPVFHIQ